MQIDIKDKDSQTLLTLYNQEVKALHSKLLNGESWQDLQTHRKNITALSIALQQQGIHLSQSNPSEFSQPESAPTEPVE